MRCDVVRPAGLTKENVKESREKKNNNKKILGEEKPFSITSSWWPSNEWSKRVEKKKGLTLKQYAIGVTAVHLFWKLVVTLILTSQDIRKKNPNIIWKEGIREKRIKKKKEIWTKKEK